MTNNLNPNLWGKYYWGTIHYTTISYPEIPTEYDKINTKQFLESFQYVLPCAKCKIHFAENLKKFQLTDEILSSKEKLIKWGVDLHNQVNINTGKKVITVSAALNIYTNKNNYNYDYKQILTIILCIILIIILIWVIKFRK